MMMNELIEVNAIAAGILEDAGDDLKAVVSDFEDRIKQTAKSCHVQIRSDLDGMAIDARRSIERMARDSGGKQGLKFVMPQIRLKFVGFEDRSIFKVKYFNLIKGFIGRLKAKKKIYPWLDIKAVVAPFLSLEVNGD